MGDCRLSGRSGENLLVFGRAAASEDHVSFLFYGYCLETMHLYTVFFTGGHLDGRRMTFLIRAEVAHFG